jgi:hypothetical protein
MKRREKERERERERERDQKRICDLYKQQVFIRERRPQKGPSAISRDWSMWNPSGSRCFDPPKETRNRGPIFRHWLEQTVLLTASKFLRQVP